MKWFHILFLILIYKLFLQVLIRRMNFRRKKTILITMIKYKLKQIYYCTVWPIGRSAKRTKVKRPQAARYRRTSPWTLMWQSLQSLSSEHTKSATYRPNGLNTPFVFISSWTLSPPPWRPSPIRTPWAMIEINQDNTSH